MTSLETICSRCKGLLEKPRRRDKSRPNVCQKCQKEKMRNRYVRIKHIVGRTLSI